ncbi:MAG: sigma-54-dependent Fis family transcriptional regulator [Candidatus Acididesulfobacter guangdongensis]|uniref:Sigma-54-dependent Fis family transcriptional regulator n=1 Tax=Acididesulfobacter guangdongensis TaxID=2597225 RepID=A0A519BGI8_ACIG2|nr:MAG: sigma-54-dependent Fis family transcriptional regulator [Candidatus Acididesulfobacter guangdongensis]
MKKILLIDDEENLLKTISLNLEKFNFKVTCAVNIKTAIQIFNNNNFDVILCDLKIKNSISGIDFLEIVRKKDPDIIFILITAYGNIENAVRAMKMGANDFIVKPVDIEGLIDNIKILLNKKNPQQNKIEPPKLFNVNLIYNSKAIKNLIEEVGLIATSNSNVLITGETGTGKELIAKIIHELSGREGEFIGLNCSAFPSDLFENELFGHEKGSYTGAANSQKGKLEIAKDGTIFLDEIGEMPLLMQSKLLRVLQEREFNKIGSNEKINFNARIISATNINLEEAIFQKKFREDLFYRINVCHITIPPLRERKEDIPKLADYFIEKYSKLNNKNIKSISQDALNVLLDYSYPGNVRELENIIERAIIITLYDSVEISNLPRHLTQKDINFKNNTDKFSNYTKLINFEIDMIRSALENNDYNQTKAAEELGISRKKLITKIKKYNL